MKIIPLDGNKNKISFIVSVLAVFWMFYRFWILVDFINTSNWKVLLIIELALHTLFPIGMAVLFFNMIKTFQWKMQKNTTRLFVMSFFLIAIIYSTLLESPLKSFNDLSNGPISYFGSCTLTSNRWEFDNPLGWYTMYIKGPDGKDRYVHIIQKDFEKMLLPTNNFNEVLRISGDCNRLVNLTYLPNISVLLSRH